MRTLIGVAAALGLTFSIPAVAQEPTPEDAEAYRQLKQAMKDMRREAELQMLVADFVANGASEENAVQLAAQVAEFFGDRPIKLDRDQAHRELDRVAPEKAQSLTDKVQDFRCDMLEKRLVSMEERSTNRGPCRVCLNGVRDCIARVDQIYQDCLDFGLSFGYCFDLWSDLFSECEDMSDQCLGACGLGG